MDIKMRYTEYMGLQLHSWS